MHLIEWLLVIGALAMIVGPILMLRAIANADKRRQKKPVGNVKPKLYDEEDR
jgi:hypothetical protein